MVDISRIVLDQPFCSSSYYYIITTFKVSENANTVQIFNRLICQVLLKQEVYNASRFEIEAIILTGPDGPYPPFLNQR